MNLNHLKYVYFVGIGGIGMSALARYFKTKGAKVVGYDKTPTVLTDKLSSEGIEIHFEENVNLIGSPDLIIYTPAIPKENLELEYCFNNNLNILKRAEALGLLSNGLPSVAIAGTHGKTSVTTLLSHLYKNSNIEVNAFLGGISANYNTNLLVSDNAEIQVVEADEYDRSFLKLNPTYAAITSVDADHLDIYGDGSHLVEGYKEFAKLATNQLFVKKEIESTINITGAITYALKDSTADYFAENIKIENGSYHFDLCTPNKNIKNLKLGIPGWHNVENAVLASAIFLQTGGNSETLKNGLANFKGVKRRFEKHFESAKKVYIDDYAHHPTEINALVTSVKELYPNDEIVGFFQPHLFTRTRDFAEGFAASLSLLNELVLVPIYPAREKPIEGINSEWLLNKVNGPKKYLLQPSSLPLHAVESPCRVVLTIGAGDIDKTIEPIKNKLIETCN